MHHRPRHQTQHLTAPSSIINKNHLNKYSLYNQLILFGRISPESVKLNSTSKDFEEFNEDEQYVPQRIEFVHTPHNTTISIKRSFSMLEDIQKQNLFKWKTEFEQTAKLAKWDNDTATEVLKSSIDARYFYLIENLTSVHEIMNVILRHKYPEDNYIKYLNMLSNTKQDDFMTIKEYKEYIGKVCERLGICMGWNSIQVSAKAEEAFYTGLSKRTKLDMSRLNIRTIVGIYEIINCTEETLKEQLSFDKITHSKKTIRKTTREDNTNSKRCSFHGVCNHKTSECRVLKVKQNQKKILKLIMINLKI
ncbi:hypothetical protein DMUE_2644 [Dictyocoela muelleri]|nr:hypothetical protein DMUE_2644 [Dictyocoela muelleri]